MASLSTLSEEQKKKAVEKATEEVKVSGARLVRITEEHYDRALDFFREYFVRDEPLHRSAGVPLYEDNREMILQSLRSNLSLMFVNEENDEILSLLTNKVEKKGFSEEADQIKHEGFRRLFVFVDECEKQANFFEHFKVSEVLQMACLMTSRSHRNKGLATAIVRATIAMVKHFGIGQVCVKSEGTSIFTHYIFSKVGMECLYEGMYDPSVFPNTGDHKSVKIFGLMV